MHSLSQFQTDTQRALKHTYIHPTDAHGAGVGGAYVALKWDRCQTSEDPQFGQRGLNIGGDGKRGSGGMATTLSPS